MRTAKAITAVAEPIMKFAIKICSFSSHDSKRRTRAQSKVAYYPPRSENHQKVTQNSGKILKLIAQEITHIKQ